jgi:hypothetical protein
MVQPRDLGYRCVVYPAAIRAIRVVMIPYLKLPKPKWIPKD